MLLQRIEVDYQAAIEDYGITEAEVSGSVLEIMIDESNKDAVDELVLAFVEKLEDNINKRESNITSDRNNEWNKI